MITEWDKGWARGVYENLELANGTPQQKNRPFNHQLDGNAKMDAGAYACEGPRTNMHVPAMTDEELGMIPMPDWNKHQHAWDNQGFCHSCGVHRHDD